MFEKLTEWRDPHTRVFKHMANGRPVDMNMIRDHIAAYEDTGLTPDEVAALKADRDQWQDGTIIVKLADAEAEVDRLCAALKLAQARAADYEADSEAGRLIRIPCREFFDGAGDAAWLVWGGEVIEMVHCGAGIGAEGRPFATLVCEDKIFPYRDGDAEHDTEMSDWCTNVKYVPADEYEQTVFTTEEAARAALGRENSCTTDAGIVPT